MNHHESVITSTKGFSLEWKELWKYRELFYFFTWRDVKVKYKQTVLGFLWAILQPVIMTLIFTIFFGMSLNIPSEGIDYPVFVLSGLIVWNIFSSGVGNAGASMVTNAHILKKIYFPRLIIPISSILVALFDFVMAFLVFLVVLFFYEVPLSLNAFIYWPLAIALAAISSMGIGCFLAALNIKYRDFRYIIPFLIQVLLFLTPVIYPVSIIGQKWMQYLVAFNPMYGAVTLFKIPMLITPHDPRLIWISLSSAFFMLVVGVLYFKKTEMYFSDLA
jgi:lipopolysaccharide transport system permease protein